MRKYKENDVVLIIGRNLKNKFAPHHMEVGSLAIVSVQPRVTEHCRLAYICVEQEEFFTQTINAEDLYYIGKL